MAWNERDGRGGLIRGIIVLVVAVWGLGSRPLGAQPNVSAHWTGTSTGDALQCHPLTFDVVIRDGQITGRATSRAGTGQPADWDVSGSVADDRSVRLVTRDSGGGKTQAARQSIRWVGQLSETQLDLVQPQSVGCGNHPRRATLTRH